MQKYGLKLPYSVATTMQNTTSFHKKYYTILVKQKVQQPLQW